MLFNPRNTFLDLNLNYIPLIQPLAATDLIYILDINYIFDLFYIDLNYI